MLIYLLLMLFPDVSHASSFPKLVDQIWQRALDDYPEYATEVGDSHHNDRWTEMSLAAIEKRKTSGRRDLQELQKIDRRQLKASDRLNYELLLRKLKMEVEEFRFPTDLIQVGPMGGPQQYISEILDITPHQSVKEYEDVLLRLKRAPAYVEQSIALMREGLRKKVILPKITLRDVPVQVEKLLPKNVEESALYADFKEMPAGMADVEKNRLRTAARLAIQTQLYPAFEKFKNFLTNEYIPRAPETVSWEQLPDGVAWYQYAVKNHTTTTLSPDEIHQIGLREVARIHEEMEALTKKAGFKGSLAEFKKFLRTDKQFYFNSAEELVEKYRDITKRMDPELAHLFGKLPRNPYGIRPVPSFMERTATTAYYQTGSAKAGRPGYFYANTYDLKSRPKWEMEALSFHESVPGHHLQISLAQEMEGLPEFRKHTFYTAFIEGWGLYSESLGRDAGFYQDPYSDFGRLSYESWRACRLVIDTGIHHKGWTRQQAIDYMLDNTSLTPLNAQVEVDRYISWPGQALAYKIGELTFQRLRKEAKEKLGDKFDIKRFHDAVLANGALPMDVLEQVFHDWLKKESFN